MARRTTTRKPATPEQVPGQVYVATQSAVTQYDGRQVIIRRGVTRVAEGHELLERLPHLFEPAGAGVHFPVTTARQEPVVKDPAPVTATLPAGSTPEGTETPQESADAAEGDQGAAGTPEGDQSAQEPADGAETGDATSTPEEQ